jgi:predicted nucleic acid-binding Zn ribbon protein
MHLLVAKQRCGSCGSGTPVWSDVCAECGVVLHSPRRLRQAGVLYLFLGMLLTAPAVYMILWAADVVAHSDDPGATTRFSGGAGDAALVFAAMGFVLLLGITGIAMGAWQVVHGRRNPRLVRVVMVFYVIFWVGAMLISYFG